MAAARGLHWVVALCCLASGPGRADDKATPLDGDWVVAFYARQFRAAGADGGGGVPIDVGLSVRVKDRLLTLTNGRESETWAIKALALGKDGAGTIDLVTPGGSPDIVWHGLVRLDGASVALRFPAQAGKDRPKEFAIRPTEEGWMLSARRAPAK